MKCEWPFSSYSGSFMEAVFPGTKPAFAQTLERLKSGEGVTFEKNLTIHLPVGEIYSYLRDLGNLPRFMKHLESVTVIDQSRSHWVAQLDGKTLKWDAQIVLDRVDEVISWQSSSGAEIRHEGSVWFKQASPISGTMVRITLEYFPPARNVPAKIAKPFWHVCRNYPPIFSPVHMPVEIRHFPHHQGSADS